MIKQLDLQGNKIASKNGGYLFKTDTIKVRKRIIKNLDYGTIQEGNKSYISKDGKNRIVGKFINHTQGIEVEIEKNIQVFAPSDSPEFWLQTKTAKVTKTKGRFGQSLKSDIAHKQELYNREDYDQTDKVEFQKYGQNERSQKKKRNPKNYDFETPLLKSIEASKKAEAKDTFLFHRDIMKKLTHGQRYKYIKKNNLDIDNYSFMFK